MITIMITIEVVYHMQQLSSQKVTISILERPCCVNWPLWGIVLHFIACNLERHIQNPNGRYMRNNALEFTITFFGGGDPISMQFL